MAATSARLEIQPVEEVLIARFRDRQVYDDRIVREAAEALFQALPTTGPIRLIVDFSGVDLVSSSLLGKLILLQRRVEGSGGKLRLCEMAPPVRAVFRTSNLDRLFAIDRDRREALEAF